MKHSLKYIFLITLGFLLSACSNAPTGNALYSYTFQTAKINYQVSGTSQGTSEVLIKNDKKIIINKIIKTALNGTKTNSDTITIQNGPKIYSLNSQTKTGTVLTNPLYKQLQKMSSVDRNKKLLEEAVNTTNQQGTTIPISKKEKKIAGQTCKVYTTTTGTVCLWENIPLESTTILSNFGINLTTVATSIKLNQNINDQEFKVPAGYQVTELN